LKISYVLMERGSAAERKEIMWTAFKNVETGVVHAVSMPRGMSPHGFAMDWPLAETKEPLTCPMCLKFAFKWCGRDTELPAMLPDEIEASARNEGKLSYVSHNF
jgi:hypothetical protein